MAKRKSKPRVRPGISVNAYAVMAECVETGISIGLRRADKHAGNPLTPDQHDRVTENIEREVMNSICEKFTFPSPTYE